MADDSAQAPTALVFSVQNNQERFVAPGFDKKIDDVIASLRVVYEKMQSGFGGPDGPKLSEISFSLTLSAEGNAFGMAKVGAERNVTVTFKK